jgi:hypothetical protein
MKKSGEERKKDEKTTKGSHHSPGFLTKIYKKPSGAPPDSRYPRNKSQAAGPARSRLAALLSKQDGGCEILGRQNDDLL